MSSDELIREVTGLKVRVDNLCARFDELSALVSQDHDTIIRMNGKFKMIEDWLTTYKKDLDEIRDELRSAVNDIKNMQSYIDEQKRVWFARITIWASIMGAIASVLLSEILTHIR